MKYAAWSFCLLSAVAIAQDTQGNSAYEELKKKLDPQNILGRFQPIPPSNIMLVQAGKPRVCAIPLLSARPPGTADRMAVLKVPVIENERDFRVPAPPCTEWPPARNSR